MTQKIITNLWFDTQAEEAVAFYTSLFKDSRVVSVAPTLVRLRPSIVSSTIRPSAAVPATVRGARARNGSFPVGATTFPSRSSWYRPLTA